MTLAWKLLTGLLYLLTTVLMGPPVLVDAKILTTQYHIQTDRGDNRFFKFETIGGQFRKETRLDDGSVVGTYGWVDADNILRVYDFIADDKGYRVLRSRALKADEVTEKDLVAPSPPRASNRRAKAEELRSNTILGQEDKRGHDRLQRRISNGDVVQVVPLFDLAPPEGNSIEAISARDDEVDNVDAIVAANHPSDGFLFSRPLEKFPFIQPRGEGHRLFYRPPPKKPSRQQRRKKVVLRARQGRRGKSIFVVKRRRNPNAILQQGHGKVDVDYQTDKAFHRERLADDGQRVGEYGYIDPLGVRRVVTYTTGPRGELAKKKENDFVGVNTYFEAH